MQYRQVRTSNIKQKFRIKTPKRSVVLKNSPKNITFLESRVFINYETCEQWYTGQSGNDISYGRTLAGKYRRSHHKREHKIVERIEKPKQIRCMGESVHFSNGWNPKPKTREIESVQCMPMNTLSIGA